MLICTCKGIHSVIKKKEVLLHAMICVYLKIILLSEEVKEGRMQDHISCMLLFLLYSRKGKTAGKEIRSVVARGWECEHGIDDKG